MLGAKHKEIRKGGELGHRTCSPLSQLAGVSDKLMAKSPTAHYPPPHRTIRLSCSLPQPPGSQASPAKGSEASRMIDVPLKAALGNCG